MAKPIILCADSTCDLSRGLLERFHVHTFPLHINEGDKSYFDGVDIQPDDIYATYREKKILPTTAAINVEEYKSYVTPFIEAGNDVIYVTLGSGLSATYNNWPPGRRRRSPVCMLSTAATCPPGMGACGDRRSRAHCRRHAGGAHCGGGTRPDQACGGQLCD